MISCFLLITLTSCVCATFVVTVTQSSYQAEENHNITLEWSFTPKPLTSHSSLYILCELLSDNYKVSTVLYHVHEGVEVPESQDEQFSGRVQSDRDALREGRVRLHVSRLRTEDSGLYQCRVLTPDGRGSETCHLNVSAAVDQPQPETPPERPEPESWGRIGLYVGLTAAAASVLLVLCLLFCSVLWFRLTKPADEKQNVSAAVETEPEPEPETEPETEPGRPNTAGRGRIGLYLGLGLTAVVVLVLFIHSFCLQRKISTQSPAVDLEKVTAPQKQFGQRRQ